MTQAKVPDSAATVESAPKLSNADRLKAIRRNLDMLLILPPGNWQAWTANNAHDFKAATKALYAAPSVLKATPFVEAVAKFYDVSPGTIDPHYGEAA